MNILDISIVYPIAAIATQPKQYHNVKIKFVEHFVVCRNVISSEQSSINADKKARQSTHSSRHCIH